MFHAACSTNVNANLNIHRKPERLWISRGGGVKSFGPFAPDTVPTLRVQLRELKEGFFCGR
jgi:hypothetical protein